MCLCMCCACTAVVVQRVLLRVDVPLVLVQRVLILHDAVIRVNCMGRHTRKLLHAACCQL